MMIIIEVRGGVVQMVHTPGNTEVFTIDWDDINTGEVGRDLLLDMRQAVVRNQTMMSDDDWLLIIEGLDEALDKTEEEA